MTILWSAIPVDSPEVRTGAPGHAPGASQLAWPIKFQKFTRVQSVHWFMFSSCCSDNRSHTTLSIVITFRASSERAQWDRRFGNDRDELMTRSQTRSELISSLCAVSIHVTIKSFKSFLAIFHHSSFIIFIHHLSSLITHSSFIILHWQAYISSLLLISLLLILHHVSSRL